MNSDYMSAYGKLVSVVVCSTTRENGIFDRELLELVRI